MRLSVARSKHDGPRLFKGFLQFAHQLATGQRNQAEQTLKAVGGTTGRPRHADASTPPASWVPLNAQVALTLEKLGIKCELDVGTSGFRVPLAVVDAADSQRYAESLYAAPLFMRGGDWQTAAAGIEAIPSWRRQPASLSWMIEARFHADDLDAVWPLIAELAWMAPRRARLLSSLLSDPQFARRVRRFDTEFDDSDAQEGFAWFPAWLLIDDGRLAATLKLAEQGSATPAERCARLVMTLLALERQGRHAEIVESRRRLRDINDALFALYMQSR